MPPPSDLELCLILCEQILDQDLENLRRSARYGRGMGQVEKVLRWVDFSFWTVPAAALLVFFVVLYAWGGLWAVVAAVTAATLILVLWVVGKLTRVGLKAAPLMPEEATDEQRVIMEGKLQQLNGFALQWRGWGVDQPPVSFESIEQVRAEVTRIHRGLQPPREGVAQ